jgi:hypothetical protein
MSRGGYKSTYRPTAWAYLAPVDCTIRWQRGDTVAYIFEGKQLETYPDRPLTLPVLATVPVPRQGWTDTIEVQRVGEAWMRDKRQRCPTCGTHS